MSQAKVIADDIARQHRRGACPTLAEPMQTGDGLLARFRPIGNALSLEALAAIAEAAAAFGNGLIEITGRGSLQVRGLSAETAPEFADAILRAVEVEQGVPVETPPLAGLDPGERRDPRPLAARLREAIAARGLVGRLSPKVTVIVDAGGRHTLSGLMADVRVMAVEDGWTVAMADARYICDSDEAVVVQVLCLLERIAMRGTLARGRDFGPAPAIDPSASRLGLGISDAAQGGEIVGLGLALGSITAFALKEFAAAAGAAGASGIRLAPGRGLYVHSLSWGAPLLALAARLGLIAAPADPRLAMSACAGREACASGTIATRSVAAEIAGAAPALFDGSFELHVSGCAKGCAHPRPALLTLVGEDGECGLIINGRAGDGAVIRFPAQRAVSGFVALEALFRASRYAQESASACLTRLGAQAIAAAFTQGWR